MKDLDVNRIFRSGCKSRSKLYKRFIYWFCKHYFYCDIHPNGNIAPSVSFAHNALGVVINENATVADGVVIQHHVTIGSTNKGVPKIRGGVTLGAYCLVLGDIEVGENAVVGAGAVVTKNVPANATVVGNPARILER